MKMHIAIAAAVLAVTAASPDRAGAEEDPSLKTFLKGSVQRARRAIAIGPTAGGAATWFPQPGESTGSVSFGLSLYTFKVPVLPDAALVADVIKSKVKERLKERIKQMIAQGYAPPDEQQQKDMAEEIFQEVKAEILGTKSHRAKTFERPSAALTWEGNYDLDAEVWSTRIRAGIGVSRLLFGITAASSFADDTIFSFGGEVALLALPGKGPRSPVFDVFLRAECPVNGATDAYSFGLGVRLLVDII
jgi:hypothetical protein